MVNPTEIIYWEILPAIRKQFVIEMKERGIRQKEIAEILRITPSAISQYINNKRGEYDFSDEFLEKIKYSVKIILEKSSTAFKEINYLVKEFEKTGNVCEICKKRNVIDGVCGVCFK